MSEFVLSASEYASALLSRVKSPLVIERLDLSAVRNKFVNDDSFLIELTEEIANAIHGKDETSLHRFMNKILPRMAKNYLKKGNSNEALQALQEIVKFILKPPPYNKWAMVFNFIARHSGNTCDYFDNYSFNIAFMALIRMNCLKSWSREVNTDNFAGKAFKAYLEAFSLDEVYKNIEEEMSKGQSCKLVNLCYNLGKAPRAMKSFVRDLTKNYSTELSCTISEVVERAVANFNALHNGNISEQLIAHLAVGEDDRDVVYGITQIIRTYNEFIFTFILLLS